MEPLSVDPARRTLLLMRHAKSAWPAGVHDVQRPLNERGLRDAPVAGRWIASVGTPDQILVSPALRTRQTAELVLQELIRPPRVVFDEGIYEAHWTTLASIVSQLPDSAAFALIIGHNPSMEDMCRHWPVSIADKAQRVLDDKFPTCTIARISVTGPWAKPIESRLDHIVIPRA